MTGFHTFFTPKGGSGVSTIAALTAINHARQGVNTCLVDAAQFHDSHALLGLPEPVEPTVPVEVLPNLHVVQGELETHDDFELYVYDVGIASPATNIRGLATVVVRNEYTALRRACNQDWLGKSIADVADGAVVVTEPGRPLTVQDVRDVLGVDICVELPWSDTIARSCDAGLLIARTPRSFDRVFGFLTHAVPA